MIEGDIKGCFDAIDHHVLMERVRRRIKDRKLLRLILAFLKADIMVEGTLRHPVTGTPQGGIISPLLANVYLTVIDERYGRWSPRPREEFAKAAGRRKVDRKAGRPTFFVVRYADDFVVLVEGTLEQAEAERSALAEFLQQKLRMELSIEKTKITDVREGFDFLGYRVVQQPAHHTCNRVGKLFIPKSKLKQLRHQIKVKVKKTPTGKSLTDLIDNLNPIIIGWRNYYRYAGRAWREFAKLDWWLERRIAHWARQKHRGARWNDLLRQYVGNRPGERRRWSDGTNNYGSSAKAGQAAFQTGAPGYRTDGMPNPRSGSSPEPIAFGRQPTPSPNSCEGHPWQTPRMESRMPGNLHVRFGVGDEETCPSDGIKRFIPTLRAEVTAHTVWEVRPPDRAPPRSENPQRCRSSIFPSPFRR